MDVAVISPTGSVLSHAAEEIVAPGVLGELGILPGHIPLLASLRPGVVMVRQGAKRELLAVGPGYLQVGAGDRVQVLVERAEKPEEIDVDEATRQSDEASAELKAGLTGSDLARAEAKLAWAKARLEAVQRAK